ncbi:MAG: HD domain-containing protein [Candidatus Eremiobacteraeota bacterium]|nr:HD domain-containing protein [Candidatus Eremiobacteraeota bacterium]
MPVDHFEFKRIADAVHGTIGISEVETAVIDTAVFQRLHDVKQLGLAPLVYPGANYTRFSHCLGTCHVAGRIISTILRREGIEDRLETVQTYRLAGLLHDIGHLPFSHAMERAVQEQYGRSGGSNAGVEPGPKFSHETIGALVVRNDKELRAALGAWAEKVEAVLAVDSKAPYRNIISSDLDADRLDYLLRTAHFTGLPYGSVDIDYIVSRVCLDDEGRVALTRHGLRAADQFLLSRYFDYRQVAYHKTTAGLEWILEDLIKAVLSVDNEYQLSRAGITDLIQQGRWKSITDSFVREWISRRLASIEKYPSGTDSPESRAAARTLRRKAEAFLDRRPPKMIGEIELFEGRPSHKEVGDRNPFQSTVDSLEAALPELSKKFDVPLDRWHVWSSDIVLTKVGSHVPTSALYRRDENKAQKGSGYTDTIRLADRHRGKSRPIFEVPQSLTSFMANYNMRIIRVYVLLDDNDGRGDEIQAYIMRAHPHEGWSDAVFGGAAFDAGQPRVAKPLQ